MSINIATFDIECTNLNADFGIILCAVIKPQGKKKIIIRGDIENKRWKTHRSDDRAVVQKIKDILEKQDIIIAHNGVRFDIPFIRTRLAKWKLEPLKDITIIDPVLLARRKFKYSWNSLESISTYLNGSSKTKLNGDKWVRAALDGDRTCMDYIVKHCIKDVLILEKIVDSVKPYCKAFDSRGSSS